MPTRVLHEDFRENAVKVNPFFPCAGKWFAIMDNFDTYSMHRYLTRLWAKDAGNKPVGVRLDRGCKASGISGTGLELPRSGHHLPEQIENDCRLGRHMTTSY
jgi:hypothetical protein